MSKATHSTATQAPAVTGDAEQVIGILDWAQRNGLAVANVTVGACHVELHRVAPAGETEERSDGAHREAIYGQFGGPALKYALESEIPAGELQPVVGRQR